MKKLGILITLFFTACYILLVLNRYWQFDYFFIDNVIFDRALWQVANFKLPVVNHIILGRINILGDHFHPTIFLLAPIYRLFQKQETILVLMVLFYSASAFVGMSLGFKIVRQKIYTLLLLFPYFLYIGTQNAFVYGFHEINLFPLFFMLTVYFLINGKKKLYFIFLTLMLLTKESLFTVGVSLGVFILLSNPREKKLGFLTIIYSLTYFLLITKFVIPGFSGRYLYGEASFNKEFLSFDLPEKFRTFFVSIAIFGFLPLLNPATLLLVLEEFMVRFIFQIPGSISHTLEYHYNLVLAPILFFSSIWSLSKMKKYAPLSLGIALLSTIIFLRFNNPRGPILLVFNSAFYQNTKNNAFVWDFLSHVPNSGSIAAQNHLGYPLSHHEVFQLPTSCDILRENNPTYLVFDLRSGQNPNNFHPISLERTKKMKDLVLNEKQYTIYFQDNSRYILKRNPKVKFKKECQKF